MGIIWRNCIDHELILFHAAHKKEKFSNTCVVPRVSSAGHLSYDTALGLYTYLGAETEYVPWASALNNLSYLKEMFTHTGSYGGLRVGPNGSGVREGSNYYTVLINFDWFSALL